MQINLDYKLGLHIIFHSFGYSYIHRERVKILKFPYFYGVQQGKPELCISNFIDGNIRA